MNQEDGPEATATRRATGEAESSRANRGWWDRNADEYQDEHGAFLGDDRFVWGPEGLDEAEAALLGPAAGLRGRDVLEIGAGAAQCSRWLAAQGARPVALDLSHRQLRHALRSASGANGAGGEPGAGGTAGGASGSPGTGPAAGGTSGAGPGPAGPVALVQADAGALPFADGSFDLACSAYGAIPFVADPVRVMREVRRVLRAGGRWVFSVTHPLRWAFPDEPGPEGLSVAASYFDRTPYVEEDERGNAVYVEHHRTAGDRVRDVVAAGFRLVDLVEPEWPDWNTQEWGGWSPLRGRLIPGTAIFVCTRD
ncbi:MULTISPECIES: class I SAM-dependent methyltransferase [Streptomyces]|uniref:Class I SAM-dependent methyltransferase n=2 Tax=Streptomyces TaxID=1883 RepID=A0A420VA85_9ACTN|nr:MULTISPECIES: methyltransferase domain-containing protein [Streptomyces]KNE83593.1 SAM-dependent methyltransferase [Streptomyces fradiae]OFA53366.1 SAM-dependent methyltransferase [Streptomyces fradiae]PQM25217.1 class I SAM-dependent methyltransferase [Streptomyces xinghaiensis]RKM99269.1 class I SAM-dependent methyltransferase [Streptomyces xinghaiensis]RNC75827.1 class I SAM-dependent methyltransferase [Streptomyces xinghaiensis]